MNIKISVPFINDIIPIEGFIQTVSPYLVNGALPPASYVGTIKSLHTDAVASAIASRADSRVLGSGPPDVSLEEGLLPRRYRSTLSQLRSGFCSSLNSYRGLIETDSDPLCPHCRGGPQTTNHLFACDSYPTSLTVIDLWERPSLVSRFLSSLPVFNLPDLPLPPPEPPP